MDLSEKILAGLSDEQRAKVAACKTPNDFLALAKEEGVELSEEQLQEVTGGWDCFSCDIFACAAGGAYH